MLEKLFPKGAPHRSYAYFSHYAESGEHENVSSSSERVLEGLQNLANEKEIGAIPVSEDRFHFVLDFIKYRNGRLQTRMRLVKLAMPVDPGL